MALGIMELPFPLTLMGGNGCGMEVLLSTIGLGGFFLALTLYVVVWLIRIRNLLDKED